MRKTALIIFLFISPGAIAQSLTDQLKDIKTYDEARKLTEKNTRLTVDMVQVNSSVDTSTLQKQFYTKKKGEIFMIGKAAYKVVYDTTQKFDRVNYIYLNGTTLSMDQIDSIRALIIQQYNMGSPFDSLSVKYTMDGNQQFGDTNWFKEDVMVKEFSQAVKKHKKGDVFTVDVLANKWFYVVKKTYETTGFKQMAIIRLQDSN